jgi:hypothetical protein
MGLHVRSKKMAVLDLEKPIGRNWTSQVKNGPHRAHGKRDFSDEPA